MASYGEEPAGFDLETTGTDALEARIATASIVGVHGGHGDRVVRQQEWLADPGIHIPAQACASFCAPAPGTSQVSHGEARRRLEAHAGTAAAR
ncbi:hypothetical protein ACIGEZ_16230 [Streptomyces sp. NPDC085481]|uniref:hypothetical protein n=1 Tax=Streptomyces sp. NPDC085481 TaxID=3365727 RepID=UPI0037D03DAE